MAITDGTNAGFVISSPSTDPSASTTPMSNYIKANKSTSPANATKITEIGWWCDNATEESNFEVGIYSHNETDNNPEALIGVSRTNAKGTDAGWKKATVDITITPNTIYWIAIQCDTTVTTTNTNFTTDASFTLDYKSGQATLPDPWGTGTQLGRISPFYAVWETTSTTSETTIYSLTDGLNLVISES